MKRRQTGFTIVEIAIVVTVVALLASILIVTFLQAQKTSRDDSRAMQARSVNAALMQYYNENGEFPDACSGANVDCDWNNLASFLTPAYIQSMPTPPPHPTKTFRYIRGTSSDSYGILVPAEARGVFNAYGWSCKTGKNIDASWWGGGFAPTCPF